MQEEKPLHEEGQGNLCEGELMHGREREKKQKEKEKRKQKTQILFLEPRKD